MEVRIGVVHTGKELTVEVEGDPDEVVRQLETALKDGAPVAWFTDAKGRRVGVMTDKIAYVEVDEDSGNRRVGFGR